MYRLTRLESYHEIIEADRCSIFIFVRSDGSSICTIEQACDQIGSFIPGNSVSFYAVDIDHCVDISLAAQVKITTFVLYRQGKECERLVGGFIDQLEYLTSRALCGLESSL